MPMVEKQFSKHIQVIQTYKDIEFKPFVTSFEKEGIVHRCTCQHIYE